MYGYLGKILFVDLSKGKVEEKEVSEDFAVKYIGGRGWAAKLLWDLTDANTNRLEPENVLIMASGPLSGLPIPGSSKTTFASIAPATGIYGDSNVGGRIGVALKHAGLDAIVVTGKAEKPSILKVDNGDVKIENGSAYWGKGAITTEIELKKDLGEEFSIAAIGQAGERQVRIACITCDLGRQAGRTGMGAVMGSKNLKAIAVRGDKDIPVKDVEKLFSVAREMFEYHKKHSLLDIWQRQGTSQVVTWANDLGIIPAYNFRDAFFEEAEKIGGDLLEKKYKVVDKCCYSCWMTCGCMSFKRG